MVLNQVAVPVGYKSSTPAIVKHLVRFGRRLREHGIHHGEFPRIIDDEHACCAVRVGKRIANVHSDGQINASLRKVGEVSDRRAWDAHRNRWHAYWLDSAGWARRQGWIRVARGDLRIAIEERRRFSHD